MPSNEMERSFLFFCIKEQCPLCMRDAIGSRGTNSMSKSASEAFQAHLWGCSSACMAEVH